MVTSFGPEKSIDLLSGLKTTDDGWGEQIRTALQIVSRDLNSKEAKKYIDRLNQESEFAGPLFNNEMWENIKKNGHIISIKTEADKILNSHLSLHKEVIDKKRQEEIDRINLKAFPKWGKYMIEKIGQMRTLVKKD